MRLLLLDIETAPHVTYTWDLFDSGPVPIDRVIEPGYTLCWSAKWFESEEVMFGSTYHDGPVKMLKRIHALLDEADAVIHYNGKTFDVPTLNREFLLQNMGPPAPYKQIDLYRVVKSEFRFASKKLDWILQELGFPQKVRHRGMPLWKGCMRNDPECWQEMETYNRGDVIGLEPVYVRIRPWIRCHPNAGVYDEPGLPVCPNCGSGNLHRRGFAITNLGKYARHKCGNCGKWSRESAQEIPKEDRQNIMRPIA